MLSSFQPKANARLQVYLLEVVRRMNSSFAESGCAHLYSVLQITMGVSAPHFHLPLFD